MIEEEWRDIPEYEGIYQVSNYGKVRSLDRYVVRRKKCYSFQRGIILKLRRNKFGYIIVGLCKKGKQKTFKVHRLVAITFIPNPNNFPQINHKNGNKSENLVDNSEWVTNKQNQDHAIKYLNANERKAKGENAGGSKLNEKEIREIKVLLKQGKLNQREIAEKYGVHPRSICNIKLNRSWKHIKA